MSRVTLTLIVIIFAQSTVACVMVVRDDQRVSRIERRMLGGCVPPIPKQLAVYCSNIDASDRRSVGLLQASDLSSDVEDVSSKVDELSGKLDDLSGRIEDIASRLGV
jgi:hypothetical protein